jgi:hypothetical protein
MVMLLGADHGSVAASSSKRLLCAVGVKQRWGLGMSLTEGACWINSGRQCHTCVVSSASLRNISPMNFILCNIPPMNWVRSPSLAHQLLDLAINSTQAGPFPAVAGLEAKPYSVRRPHHDRRNLQMI